VKVKLVTTNIGGGAGRAAYRLHDGLRAIDVDSTVLVKKGGNSDKGVIQLERPTKTRIRRLQERLTRAVQRYSSPQVAFGKNCQTFSSPNALWNESWKHTLGDADVINLHWISWFIDIPSFAQLSHTTPVVWTLHDMNAFTGGCHYNGTCERFQQACGSCPELTPNGPRDMSADSFEVKCKAYAKFKGNLTIVTPSRWLGECVERSALLGDCHRHVIPYGIDTETFRPVSGLRDALGIPPESKVALFIANGIGTYRKGGDLFQAALGMLDVPNLHVVVAGHGKFSEPIENATVHYLGDVSSSSLLAAVYSTADFTVIPSRQDNLPNTVIESIACGTPVVAFDVGGLPDMVRPGLTGWLAEDLSAESLATAISSAIELPQGRYQQQCRDVAIAEYPLELQAQRYKELFSNLIHDHRPQG